MKKSILITVLGLLFVLTAVSGADAFHCGTKLVKVGDTKSEIIRKCGAPTWQDSWLEERVERVVGAAPSWKGKFSGTRIPVAAIVYITIEEWTYNLGPTQFIRILRFENNRLVDIDTGDYGY